MNTAAQAISVSLCRAFTLPNADGHVSGNPAGVVLDAERLSPEKRQTIAKEIGVSETVFVCCDKQADFFLFFHTPTKAIDNCGHATVAAYTVLRDTGRIAPGEYVSCSAAGITRITVLDDRIGLQLPRTTCTALSTKEKAAVCNGLGTIDLSSCVVHTIASAGVPFVLIEGTDVALLHAITPDYAEIRRTSEMLGVCGYYIFVQNEQSITSRMFAPYYGIDEESATGMAAAALSGFLASGKTCTFAINQGMNMKSPGFLKTETTTTGTTVFGTAEVTSKVLVSV